jgi:hypothetical protein
MEEASTPGSAWSLWPAGRARDLGHRVAGAGAAPSRSGGWRWKTAGLKKGRPSPLRLVAPGLTAEANDPCVASARCSGWTGAGFTTIRWVRTPRRSRCVIAWTSVTRLTVLQCAPDDGGTAARRRNRESHAGAAFVAANGVAGSRSEAAIESARIRAKHLSVFAARAVD